MYSTQNVLNEFKTVDKINQELNKIASRKSRLKKQTGKKNFENDLKIILEIEESLKSAKRLIEVKDKPVTMFNQEDVDKLDYNETLKAIKSIQTKKCLTKWMTTIENDNDDYRNALSIEQMLVNHKLTLKPNVDSRITIQDIQNVIEQIQQNPKIKNDIIVDMLQKLL